MQNLPGNLPQPARRLAEHSGAARGQVIGSTDDRGSEIKDGRLIPADLAATVMRHLEIDLRAQWTDQQGRPHPIISDGGRPIRELG